jgi:hypothetical protein
MAAVLLGLREDSQFDRFLAAIGLRNPTGPDVVARLNICERRLQHFNTAVIAAFRASLRVIARPSAALPETVLPSTPSIVPLTRWVWACCCAKAVATARGANAEAASTYPRDGDTSLADHASSRVSFSEPSMTQACGNGVQDEREEFALSLPATPSGK